MTNLQKTSSSKGDLLYLIRGKDKERDAWHYVLIDRLKLPIFKKDTEKGDIDILRYGKIIRSGWGKNPPDDVMSEIKSAYS